MSSTILTESMYLTSNINYKKYGSMDLTFKLRFGCGRRARGEEGGGSVGRGG